MTQPLPQRPKEGGHQPDCPICVNRDAMGMIACLTHRTPDERVWRNEILRIAREG